MHNVKDVLDWLDSIFEGHESDPVYVNRVTGQSRALAQYFTECVKLKSIPRDAFPHQRPAYFAEAQQLYINYLLTEENTQQIAKISTLEGKLEGIEKQLKALIEAQTPKQKAKIAEAVDDDPPAQDDGDAQEDQPDPVEPAAEGEPEAEENETD